MIIFILCLVPLACGTEISLNGVLPQSESLFEIPKEAMDGDPHLIQEDVTSANTVPQGRQNEEDDEDDEPATTVHATTTTQHWSEKGCTGDNEYYNACGPRCYQTCSFQQRVNGRNTRAVCESIFAGSCHAGKEKLILKSVIKRY